jgi:hypothetical protein
MPSHLIRTLTISCLFGSALAAAALGEAPQYGAWGFDAVGSRSTLVIAGSAESPRPCSMG